MRQQTFNKGCEVLHVSEGQGQHIATSCPTMQAPHPKQLNRSL